MSTYTWQPDLSKEEFKTTAERITSQAYMDDTTWFSRSKNDIKNILTIANEFYTLNNI